MGFRNPFIEAQEVTVATRHNSSSSRLRMGQTASMLPLLVTAFVLASIIQSFAATVAPEVSVAQHAGRLYGNHDLAGATEVLRQGVKQHPNSAQLHFMLGNALMRSHKWSAAIPEFRKAAQLRPDHPDSYLNLGYACYHAGEVQQAVDAWRTAAKASPNDALIRATLATGLLKAGDRADAFSEIALVERLDPLASWRKIADIDFRWDAQMRAAADQLLANKTMTGEHSQSELVQWS